LRLLNRRSSYHLCHQLDSRVHLCGWSLPFLEHIYVLEGIVDLDLFLKSPETPRNTSPDHWSNRQSLRKDPSLTDSGQSMTAVTEKAAEAYQEALRLCGQAKQSGAFDLSFPLGRWLLELPPELERLTLLQSLDLRACVRINGLGPVAALTSLKSLNLHGCRQISDLKPLTALTSLQSLDLSWCTQIRLEQLAALTSLQFLDLYGCKQISDLKLLAALTSLQSLNLSWCKQISDLEPLAALTSLQSLNLRGCRQISDLGPLAALTSLQSLNLSECAQITSLKPLAALPSLRSIDLWECPYISGLAIAALPSLDERSRTVHAREGVEALYREGRLFLLVKLAEARASSWGVRLRLTTLAQFGGWMHLKPAADFDVGAPWEMFFTSDSEWSMMYGGTLFFDTQLIEEAKRVLCKDLPERYLEVEKLIQRYWSC
jgi:hypothetical protein